MMLQEIIKNKLSLKLFAKLFFISAILSAAIDGLDDFIQFRRFDNQFNSINQEVSVNINDLICSIFYEYSIIFLITFSISSGILFLYFSLTKHPKFK